MLIEIKNLFGKVLFSLDKEDNSVKDTLEEAVRQGVDLRCAHLSHVDIQGANLAGGKFDVADFRGADLSYVNFSHANLSFSDLRISDLTGVNLEGADITNADFYFAKNVPDLPMACPREGSFIGWKKVWKYKEEYEGEFIVKLEIPEDAKRSSATSNKCRCSKAKVLEIRDSRTGECIDTITNTNVYDCVYKVGEYVYPDSFDEYRWGECSHGIHFFMKMSDAIKYFV